MATLPDIQSALPSGGVPATGEFTPTQNITENTYDTQKGQNDSPYNQLIGMTDTETSALPGQGDTPYLNAGLPAYIPTLYWNMYQTNINLQNEIPAEDMSDNRLYPTSLAVKKYVQTQLFGSEIIDTTSSTDTLFTISTGITSSLILGAPSLYQPTGQIPMNILSIFDSETLITTYVTSIMIDPIDTTRNGAQKNVMCISALGQDPGLPTNYYYMQMSAGYKNDSAAFVVNGAVYKYYAFTNAGDSLVLIQYIASDGNGISVNRFFVMGGYSGIFSNDLIYSDSNGNAKGITDQPDS